MTHKTPKIRKHVFISEGLLAWLVNRAEKNRRHLSSELELILERARDGETADGHGADLACRD